MLFIVNNIKLSTENSGKTQLSRLTKKKTVFSWQSTICKLETFHKCFLLVCKFYINASLLCDRNFFAAKCIRQPLINIQKCICLASCHFHFYLALRNDLQTATCYASAWFQARLFNLLTERRSGANKFHNVGSNHIWGKIGRRDMSWQKEVSKLPIKTHEGVTDIYFKYILCKI